jgi:hypothetical protein
MKRCTMLVVSTLLSILLVTFHQADDTLRGFEPGTLKNAPLFLITLVWLYGALVFRGKRWGYAITLLGGLLGLLMTYAHMRGTGLGVGGNIAASEGALFYIWTLAALGVTSTFSTALSVHGLVDPKLGEAG